MPTPPPPPPDPLDGPGTDDPALRSPARPPARRTADGTRTRIIHAALDALRHGGIAGISARGIAREGGFNQALIFYHFGSVEGLLIEVARSESERRSALYADTLAEVASLRDLVAVARRLHDEEFKAASMAALTQMLAGAAVSPDMAHGIWDALEPWTALVRQSVERLLAGTPFAGILPADDLASAVAALFLGIELVSSLDPDGPGTSMFTTMEAAAQLIDTLLMSQPSGPPPGTGPPPAG